MGQQLVVREMCRRRFEPAAEKIRELLQTGDECIVVAIDGMSASGKSTLGFYLKELFECNLFHMDDFFLQDCQRTKERLSQVGGNVDYERFQEEVLVPILKKETVTYRPFRCDVRKIQEGAKIPFKGLNIIEGSYSQHPYFGEAFKLRIFTEISSELQIERIRKRNGEIMLRRFQGEWIPKENAYFERFHIKENSDIVL